MSIKICFVCLGNICRSPTAEGVMKRLVREAGLEEHFEIESAGTGGWHVGEPPDPRTQAAARKRGVALTSRAQQFQQADFARFDYVVAMDRDNHANLERLAPSEAARAKIHLFRDFDPASPEGAAVPDPYYGGADGFDEVFDLVEAAARGLLAQLIEAHGVGR